MTEHFRYIWQLLVLSSLMILSGILLISRLGLPLEINHYIITLISVTGINLASWLILARGVNKNNRDGAGLMILGISAKFLLYLIYILAFWLVTKNISKPFIISFFTLYLVFTLLLAGNLLKLLKNK
ncbi:MAG: hypothetical protein E4H16_05460 [Candidatus Atribacteria bacterium]|nr:MAG: hypothetical protein E4H16_05460 [Candidatus Atribacteria bacterium]